MSYRVYPPFGVDTVQTEYQPDQPTTSGGATLQPGPMAPPPAVQGGIRTTFPGKSGSNQPVPPPPPPAETGPVPGSPPPNGQPPPNGGYLPPEEPPMFDPSAPPAEDSSWWAQRSQLEKGAMIVGGAAVVGLVFWGLTRGDQMTPNLRGAKRSELTGKKTGQRMKIGKRSYEIGKVIDLGDGDRWGHKIPPKEYRNKGARRKSDYAWPEGYKYPLIFRDRKGRIKPKLTRKHVRAAASYFARHHADYPRHVQRTILRNINQAKKRFGVGDEPLTI